MKIVVNGKPVKTGASTLTALLDELGQGDAKVATSVNETFVPKTQRSEQALQDGDRVEIVAPRQGG